MHTAQGRHQLVVRTLNARATVGVLDFGPFRLRCALGRSGWRTGKREGDGASPAGQWRMREALYRADRVRRPASGLRLRAIAPEDGWGDQPGDRNYNRPVRHPYRASAERLWREDGLYDVVVVLGYNDVPRSQGRGSAIFLHCAAAGFTPTAGCIAVRRVELLRLLPRLRSGLRVVIGGVALRRSKR